MPDCLRAALNCGDQIPVAGDVRARKDFRACHDALHGSCCEDLPCAPKGGEEDFAVARIEQPVGGHDGEDGGVVADNRDVPAGKWRREAGKEGGEVLSDCVQWGREELVTEIGVNLEVLDIGPVAAVSFVECIARSGRERSIGEFLKGEEVTAGVGEDAGALRVVFSDCGTDCFGVGKRVMGYHVDGVGWAGKNVVPQVLANTGTVGA